MENTATYCGERTDDLSRAFDLVKPARGWKYPIAAKLPLTTSPETLRRVSLAIDYFAGGGTAIRKTEWNYVITAPGYYSRIGA